MEDVEDGTAFSATVVFGPRHRLDAQSFESPCCQVPSLRVSVAGVTWCSDHTSATAEI